MSTVLDEPVAAVQGEESLPAPRRRRRRWRVGLAIVVGVLVVALAVVAVPNRDLIVAYLTHRVGEPAQSV